jgi:hypothetical protein
MLKRLTSVTALMVAINAVATTGVHSATAPPTGYSLSFDLAAGICGVSVEVGGVYYYGGGLPGEPSTLKLDSGFLQCKAELRVAPPEQAIVVNTDRTIRFVCWDGARPTWTTDWQILVTPSGKISYTCHATV